MQKIKNIIHIIGISLISVIIVFMISIQLYPNKVSKVLEFKFYTVMSDSMEPTIPTYSLVLSKIIPKDLEIKPNSIVTFEADRFGENILLTHYYRKTQEKDGKVYYRTQQEGEDINDVSTYDNYETTRDDIIGTYVTHVPYLGKIFLFLKSPFGFIMYAELFVVFLVNQFVKAKWKEKDKKVAAEAGVELAKGDYEEGFVEGDIEVLIDINDFNNSDEALLEMEEFNKKQLSEWH